MRCYAAFQSVFLTVWPKFSRPRNRCKTDKGEVGRGKGRGGQQRLVQDEERSVIGTSRLIASVAPGIIKLNFSRISLSPRRWRSNVLPVPITRVRLPRGTWNVHQADPTCLGMKSSTYIYLPSQFPEDGNINGAKMKYTVHIIHLSQLWSIIKKYTILPSRGWDDHQFDIRKINKLEKLC